MALNTNIYGFVIDPLFSFCDQGGKTIANGYVRVFRAGTSTPVLTYRNYDGAFNAETIELDNSGRTMTQVIASKGDLYKVCVYDAEHSQEDPILTVDKVAVIGSSVNATNIVQGLNDVAGSGWIKSVAADDTAEISLDATNVTSEVDTMVNATAASADYMVPLVHKAGSDPDKKITLGNIFKFVLNFIHSLTDTATESDIASGNYFALDGSAGTKKLNSTTLLTKTAQNALAGNVASEFIPSSEPNPTTTVAGLPYMYKGSLYIAKEAYQGPWDATKFAKVTESELVERIKTYAADAYKTANGHYVKTFNESASGGYNYPFFLEKGRKYRVTNTSASGQMTAASLNFGGTLVQTITNGISSNVSIDFVASDDAYQIRFYWNVSNGSCTIECLDGIHEQMGNNDDILLDYIVNNFHSVNGHYVKEFSGTASDYTYEFKFFVQKGLKYRVTNTSASGQMTARTTDADGNHYQTITNGISSGSSADFVASGDAYGLALYWNVSGGSCTIECLDGIYERTRDNFSKSFVPNVTITEVNSFYWYNGSLYVAKVDGYQGPWDDSKFTKTDVGSLLDILRTYIADNAHQSNSHYVKTFTASTFGSHDYNFFVQKGRKYRVTNTSASGQMTASTRTLGGSSIQNVTNGISSGVSADFVASGDAYVLHFYWNVSNGSCTIECLDGIYEKVEDEQGRIVVGNQLPANGSSGSVFNAETLTASELYDFFEDLIDKAFAPTANFRKTPKIITKYYKTGVDSSGELPLNAYVLTKRNRFGWIHADALYAWKNGATLVFTDSCSPRIGDNVYSDANRTDFGYTVSSYSSASKEITVNSIVYEQSDEDNVAADVLWSKIALAVDGSTSTLDLYFRDDTLSGSASVSGDTLSLSGKEYVRCDSFDYHTEQKGTIVLWGNEHGPQSDPAEPCITLYNFAEDFVKGNNPCEFFEYLKENYKIIIVPLLNPYGLDNHTRNNANNVNINRNYPTEGWSVVADLDKGSYAGDQNETQFIMNLLKTVNPDFAIDVHCYGYMTANNNGYVTLYATGLNNALISMAAGIINGFGFALQHLTNINPLTNSTGEAWLQENSITGALIEMNAGHYSAEYNGYQHLDIIMNLDYTWLLNAIRICMG